MKNKKVILSVLAGIVIASAIIAWLMLSGDKPITVKPGDGVTAQINASLKTVWLKGKGWQKAVGVYSRRGC